MKKVFLIFMILTLVSLLFTGCVFTDWMNFKNEVEDIRQQLEDADEGSDTEENTSEEESLLPLLTLEEYVTDFLNESSVYKDSVGNDNAFSYRVPQINIDSHDAEIINSEINNRFASVYDELLENKKKGVSNDIIRIDYKAYLNGDILSVSVWKVYSWEYTDYNAYNINARTGKRLSNADLIGMTGYNNDEFYEFLKKLNTEYFENMYNNYSLPDYEYFYQYNISDELLNLDIPMYIGEDGYLYVVSNIASVAGASSYEHIINTKLVAEG